VSTTPNCGYIGGHAEGYDDSCAWCVAAAYMAELNAGEAALASTPTQLPAGVVAQSDQGEAAAMLALDRCVTIWDKHRQTKSRTATLLGTTMGLQEVVTREGAADTIVGMLAVAIMRLAEAQGPPAEALEPWHGKAGPA
jgi:hypothetical protein